jgi:hypothetical protein
MKGWADIIYFEADSLEEAKIIRKEINEKAYSHPKVYASALERSMEWMDTDPEFKKEAITAVGFVMFLIVSMFLFPILGYTLGGDSGGRIGTGIAISIWIWAIIILIIGCTMSRH